MYFDANRTVHRGTVYRADSISEMKQPRVESEHKGQGTESISATARIRFHREDSQEDPRLKRTKSCYNMVNVADEKGRTPLLHAIFSENIDLIDQWITEGADVNQCDHEGLTPLMAAAKSGNLQALARLLAADANVHAVDCRGNTAVIYLERLYRPCGHSFKCLPQDNTLQGFIKDLLIDKLHQVAHGTCNINIEVEDYEIACNLACNWAQSARLPEMMALPIQGAIQPYHVCQWVYNHYVRLGASHCVFHVTFEEIRRVLEVCVSMHGKDRILQGLKLGEEVIEFREPGEESGRTSLMYAVCLNEKESVESLLKMGADTEARFFHMTPLMRAVFLQNMIMIRLLLEANADIEACDNDGKTALMDILQRSKAENEKIAKCLLDAGANVNHVDGKGLTPILVAADREGMDSSLFNLLIAYGADYEKSVCVRDFVQLQKRMDRNWTLDRNLNFEAILTLSLQQSEQAVGPA